VKTIRFAPRGSFLNGEPKMERPVTDTGTLVSGREFDLRAGITLAPTLIFIGYGVVKFFTLGTALTHWPDTYLAVAGGVASWISVLLWGVIVSGRKRASILRSVSAFSAFIPMLYSLYAIAYLGIYTIYASTIISFSVLGILFGAVCVASGYRMANGLAALTGLPRRHP
jgi:hypothetical protein